jgi:hypothetical protein
MKTDSNFLQFFLQFKTELVMDDPRVYDILSLMLDELRENRKSIDRLEGTQQRHQTLLQLQTDVLERLELRQQRQEMLLQRQTDMLEQYFTTVASPQAQQLAKFEQRQDEMEHLLATLKEKHS